MLILETLLEHVLVKEISIDSSETMYIKHESGEEYVLVKYYLLILYDDECFDVMSRCLFKTLNPDLNWRDYAV